MFVVCLYIYCIKSAFEPDEASVYSTWYTYHLLSILASDSVIVLLCWSYYPTRTCTKWL